MSLRKKLFIIFLALYFTSGGDSLQREYGEACGENDDCKTMDLLTCESGICNCANRDEMLYDQLTNRCVALAGKHCGEIKIKDVNVHVPCVEDAICDSKGICVCMDNFFQSSASFNKSSSGGGICVRRMSFGEPCNTSIECESSFSKPLICIEGACKCDPEFQIYNYERKQCVGRIGSECNLGNLGFNECVQHSECKNGHCSCHAGYSINMNGSCGLGHGLSCDKNNPCGDQHFICFNGKCKCKYNMHQIFDPNIGECLSFVSGPCTINNDTQKCVKNAHCVDREFFPECVCKQGFVQIKTGECVPGYMEECHGDECDPLTPLSCINQRCQCPDLLQVYDEGSKICVGLVGSRCEVPDGRCVEFASCVQQEDNLDISGKCQCKSYSTQQNRYCIYTVEK